MIWPVFVCICILFAAVGNTHGISFQNIPYLAVYFFIILFCTLIAWGMLYAIDKFCLSRFQKWIASTIGDETLWKLFLSVFCKLLLYFAVMLLVFAVVSGIKPALEETEAYTAGYGAGYETGFQAGYESGYETGFDVSWTEE